MLKQVIALATALCVLAIAQYVTAAAWAAVAALTVMVAVVHPRAVLNLIAGLGLLAVALRAPAAMAAALAAIGVASVVAGHVAVRRRRPPKPAGRLRPMRALLPAANRSQADGRECELRGPPC